MEFVSNGMKYKPPRHKRHKSRSISYLIPHCKHILVSLLESNNNVNGLFRILQQTGFNYKRDVLDSIDYLEKAQFIRKNRTENSMKILISLTDPGMKISKLIVNVDKYIQSYSKLDDSMVTRFEYPYIRAERRGNRETLIYDPEILPTVLAQRGWTDEEIDQFLGDECRPSGGLLNLTLGSPRIVINILLHKYLLLLELELNEIAKTITQKITIDLITELLAHLYIPTRDKEFTDLDNIVDAATDEALGLMYDVVHSQGLLYSFMNNDVFDVLNSVFSIVEPRKRYLKDQLDTEIVSQRYNRNKLQSDPDYDWNESEARILPFLEQVFKKAD